VIQTPACWRKENTSREKGPPRKKDALARPWRRGGGATSPAAPEKNANGFQKGKEVNEPESKIEEPPRWKGRLRLRTGQLGGLSFARAGDGTQNKKQQRRASKS